MKNNEDELELSAMGTVFGALKNLDSDAQSRVIRWAIEKLDLNIIGSGSASRVPWNENASDSSVAGTVGAGLTSAAHLWLKQNSLDQANLETVFHIENNEVNLIAPDVPGRSNREKTLNCYVLAGIRELLRSGESTFSDDDARNICTSIGCLDKKNHAATLKEKGNEFTGSKERGWTLTAPGKKRAATLIVEIASQY